LFLKKVSNEGDYKSKPYATKSETQERGRGGGGGGVLGRGGAFLAQWVSLERGEEKDP